MEINKLGTWKLNNILFFALPLSLIILSVGGIFFIIWRKAAGLENLAESNGFSGGFSFKKDWPELVKDFFPELLSWIKSVQVKEKLDEYKELWFIEVEKFLRRFRLFSLKMDRFSDTLIKKIRTKTQVGARWTYSVGEVNKSYPSQSIADSERDAKEEFKKSEQKLILEIAKNPKNALLYEELGDLYFKMSGFQDAKESYEAAIELNPNNEELNKKLSQTLEKSSKPEVSQK